MAELRNAFLRGSLIAASEPEPAVLTRANECHLFVAVRALGDYLPVAITASTASVPSSPRRSSSFQLRSIMTQS